MIECLRVETDVAQPANELLPAGVAAHQNDHVRPVLLGATQHRPALQVEDVRHPRIVVWMGSPLVNGGEVLGSGGVGSRCVVGITVTAVGSDDSPDARQLAHQHLLGEGGNPHRHIVLQDRALDVLGAAPNTSCQAGSAGLWGVSMPIGGSHTSSLPCFAIVCRASFLAASILASAPS